nr:alpha/beta hydrolase [Candidatus Pantoea persica]
MASLAIQRFRPGNPNGEAVLIAGGGGYKFIGIGCEAWPVARWLNSNGYTAYVLSYRLPEENWQAGHLAPLQDAQRAIRPVRSFERKVQCWAFQQVAICLAWPLSDPISAPIPRRTRSIRWCRKSTASA